MSITFTTLQIESKVEETNAHLSQPVWSTDLFKQAIGEPPTQPLVNEGYLSAPDWAANPSPASVQVIPAQPSEGNNAPDRDIFASNLTHDEFITQADLKYANGEHIFPAIFGDRFELSSEAPARFIAQTVYKVMLAYGVLSPDEKIRGSAHAGQLVQELRTKYADNEWMLNRAITELANIYDMNFGDPLLAKANQVLIQKTGGQTPYNKDFVHDFFAGKYMDGSRYPLPEASAAHLVNPYGISGKLADTAASGRFVIALGAGKNTPWLETMNHGRENHGHPAVQYANQFTNVMRENKVLGTQEFIRNNADALQQLNALVRKHAGNPAQLASEMDKLANASNLNFGSTDLAKANERLAARNRGVEIPHSDLMRDIFIRTDMTNYPSLGPYTLESFPVRR